MRTQEAVTGDKDPNTHQAHAGYIGSTDNKSLQCAQWAKVGFIENVPINVVLVCSWEKC